MLAVDRSPLVARRAQCRRRSWASGTSCAGRSPPPRRRRSRGFCPARFSFNTAAGGRCTACEGQGAISHEMSFLPDVVTPCEVCGGARFDAATLEVRYHGLTIGEVLRLSADEAKEVFRALPKVAAPLECLSDLGVGYLQLGQGSNTLSGGEAQRLKLAAELTATRATSRRCTCSTSPPRACTWETWNG